MSTSYLSVDKIIQTPVYNADLAMLIAYSVDCTRNRLIVLLTIELDYQVIIDKTA